MLGLDNVTVKVNASPGQVPEVGVIVYTPETSDAVVFVSVPLITDPLPEEPPVNPLPEGADHVYVVAAGTIPSVIFAGVNENALPLHTVSGLLLIAGFGFTVTVTVNVLVHVFGAVPDVAVTL
jgi:hypothetical protein